MDLPPFLGNVERPKMPHLFLLLFVPAHPLSMNNDEFYEVPIVTKGNRGQTREATDKTSSCWSNLGDDDGAY